MSRSALFGHDRRGFTLAELMITMTMISVIGAAVVSVFTSQQKFVRAASDVGGIRSQIQTATIVLPAELRNISPVGGDIRAMSDSAITIRTTIATSVVCGFTATTITLAPEGNLASTTSTGGNAPIRLTATVMTPAAGDSVFIWDEGPTGQSQDDSWTSAAGTPYALDDVISVPGGCVASYAPAGNILPALELAIDLGTPLLPTLQVGAGVRVTREVSYGLYQSDADGRWYLGYRDANLADYEYVAGPFLPYAAAGETGLRFRYYDSVGAEITNYALAASVARIEIAAHARAESQSALGGVGSGKQQEDSLRVGVSLRNRS